MGTLAGSRPFGPDVQNGWDGTIAFVFAKVSVGCHENFKDKGQSRQGAQEADLVGSDIAGGCIDGPGVMYGLWRGGGGETAGPWDVHAAGEQREGTKVVGRGRGATRRGVLWTGIGGSGRGT
ncbi:hypothetical protein FS749_013763 [Ceratobasidium sp. UAMH 11750]|nr:hypothetical protein FS749_013763 [Ceratobasidium sp. UAMH 11750]